MTFPLLQLLNAPTPPATFPLFQLMLVLSLL
jgi:hypothetical protein